MPTNTNELYQVISDFLELEDICERIAIDEQNISTPFFPEGLNDNQAKVNHSIIGVAIQNTQFIFITLAVRYYPSCNIVEVRAIEDVAFDDRGWHLQRFAFKKDDVNGHLRLRHIKEHSDIIFHYSEIPCGKKLPLYAGNGDILLQGPATPDRIPLPLVATNSGIRGVFSSEYSILRASRLVEKSDIPCRGDIGRITKCIKEREGITFEGDLNLIKGIFSCIFIQRKVFRTGFLCIDERYLSSYGKACCMLTYDASTALSHRNIDMPQMYSDTMKRVISFLSIFDKQRLRLVCREKTADCQSEVLPKLGLPSFYTSKGVRKEWGDYPFTPPEISLDAVTPTNSAAESSSQSNEDDALSGNACIVS